MLPIMIICEGVEDEAFLKNLLEIRSLGSCDFHLDSENVGHLGGVKSFGKILKGIVSQRDIEKRRFILIVADNDGEPSKKFREVQEQIRLGGCIPPDNPREPKEQTNLPPIIVLMIPWDNTNGCLETLCLISAVNKHPDTMICVDGLVKCVNPRGWEEAKIAKLRMRCYLSSVCKADPNTGLRFAWASDRMPQDPIPLSDPCFNQIAEYLATLIVQ